jgi:hypothetical protein
VNKRTAADAQRIAAGTVITGNWDPKNEAVPVLPNTATPLDVMVEAMRRAYRLGGPLAAAPYAERAAPYLHAKISSIELKTPTAPGMGNTANAPRMRIEFVKPKKEEDTDGS